MIRRKILLTVTGYPKKNLDCNLKFDPLIRDLSLLEISEKIVPAVLKLYIASVWRERDLAKVGRI